jgi:DNA repair protein RadC
MKKTIKIVSLRMVREQSIPYSSDTVASKEDVIRMVRPLFENSAVEKAAVLGVDAMKRPTVISLFYGDTDQCCIYPKVCMKTLLLSNSNSFFIIHNHPGDTLSASEPDWRITQVLKSAGAVLDITLLDHLIVNADCTGILSLRDQARWCY